MLTAVKGVGPWSAGMFLLFHRQLPDLLPLGSCTAPNDSQRILYRPVEYAEVGDTDDEVDDW
jgi:3-methyladenine DNA glycosylase/8-oxoguanine DNA glycosylase